MSVELMPATQLGFNRPLTQTIKRTLHIHNPHPHPVAFKVKTTAPKQYCVRPNSGRVEVGETVEVTVLLQALPQDPPAHAKCRDKFLVQSAFITPDEEMRSLSEMWANVEKADKSAIHEQKLKCVYLPAEDGSNANGIPEEAEEVAGVKTPQNAGDQSRMLDESQIYTAAESSPINAESGHGINGTKEVAPTPIPASAAAASVAKPTDAPAASTASKEIPSLTVDDVSKVGVSPTNAALEKGVEAATTSSTPEELLQAALKEIEKLKSELSEAAGPAVTGLRRRGGAAVQTAETTVEKVKEATVSAAQGVPVEVVAALVFGVFVLTYLFF